MKALVFEKFGGPDVLHYQEIASPVMGPDEVLIEMKAIGLNFADVYRRKGNYHLAGDVTEGNGADVVFESVGSTLMDSFEITRVGGTVVFFGMAGGDPVSVDPRMLMDTSKTLTGGDLWNVLTSHEERVSRSHELFGWIQEGKLKVSEPTAFPLSEGAKAHEYLESRKSTGKILLIP
ncbi:zinc-binding dehydrogenase [Bacillus sp. CH30_1T]|uniref:zinc-binding dehydrogenase n=1 Tax=Bacillus sp. CH30_1T TaxID=2604836 RepID=UPI0011EC1323|nr:zinc-binding dehydrogenase [Bacillus sp. CH30_1T]KAA0563539.1 zinc-binding dehydrogenase [Bacillus sp. CH30_1T]